MPRCAVNVDLSWPLNPSLLVSLKPGRQRLPWHLWHGLALHCGLNYWWRALLSQCVLPTFKWNSADWAVTASSLPATSTWHLWCGSDCTEAINFQWSLHSEWRSLTITKGWFLNEQTTHSSILYTKGKHPNICKSVSGICDPFLLLRLSLGFQDFVLCIWFSSVFFWEDGWTYLSSTHLTDTCQNFHKILLAMIYVYARWSFCLLVFASKASFDISSQFLKWFYDPDSFSSSSNEWNKQHVYAYMYVCICICVLKCIYAHAYVLCVYIYDYFFQRIQWIFVCAI